MVRDDRAPDPADEPRPDGDGRALDGDDRRLDDEERDRGDEGRDRRRAARRQPSLAPEESAVKAETTLVASEPLAPRVQMVVELVAEVRARRTPGEPEASDDLAGGE